MSTMLRARGFTAIEMTVALAIIGLLTGVTILAFRGMKNRAGFAAATGDLIVQIRAT
ncbi:MAG: prepilin-type N-terminal cleavage/methylation domain-containing protein, partial [Myxococcales bacterium]